jgi:hypothetical protein
LNLFRGSELIAQNDDWSAAGAGPTLAAVFARVGAFPLTIGSTDAALVTTLTPGNYTVQISDPAGEGNALAEIYDAGAAGTSDSPRLVNLSTRANVTGTSQILTGGFVIAGNTAKRVLVRAVGPGLARFGVTGTLADPRVTVSGATGVVAENDNWTGSEAASLAAASGAFALPDGSRDAVLVLTLASGAYTAQVAGVNGASGIALLEVYEIP